MMSALAVLAASAQHIDVLHYKFHIDLNDQNDTIYGRAELKVAFLQRMYGLPLSLTAVNGKGKGMLVTNIESSAHWAYTQKGEILDITPERPFAVGDTFSFTIHYKGIPADGLIIAKNKYNRRSFFADNWPDRGHNWLPCHDTPSDKATVEFIVTAPLHYQVVSNGIQVEETNLGKEMKRTHWREDVPISTKVMVIGVADFAVGMSGMVNDCIPIYSWVYPEDRDKGFYDYGQAMEIMPFFIKNVGPYAYKKLANVQSKTIFGGLENANTIFYSESSVGGNRKSEALITHEIAHQWFGNMATEKTFAHLWLSEGFATYMTILYLENKYGRDTAVSMLKQDRREVAAFAKTSNRTVVDTTHNYMELLNPNSYQKGGWILHMLRSELGDSVFWKGIRKYYATYAGTIADTEDLRKILESVSGKNLETFFKQWLYTPGIPVLDMGWKYDAGSKMITLTVKQLRGKFEFPIEILVQENANKAAVRKTFRVKDEVSTFKISATSSPYRVEIDPMTVLLFEGELKETR